MTKNKNYEDLPHTRQAEEIQNLELQEAHEKKDFDVHSRKSSHRGIAGLVESFIRTFRGLSFFLVMLPLGLVYILCFGIAIFPGLTLSVSTFNAFAESHALLRYFFTSLSLAVAYCLYGITLIFIVPFFNKILCLKLRPWRGGWFSLRSIPWYYHNGLVQLVRYTFLDFITPTPLNVLFYRMMGMKVGKGVMINTTNISDPCLITIEDNVTVGGSATIFGHYAQGGYLILAPVIIKKGATIGLKASIMGDVIVGEKVTVRPHTILLPKTRMNKGDPMPGPEDH